MPGCCISEIEYLAIPYSSKDSKIMDYRADVSDFICSELMKEGRIIYAPISSAHFIAKKHGLPRTWDYWERFDREFVRVCSRVLVVMLEGWETSTGVTAECELAIEFGIPIEYVDPNPYIEKYNELKKEFIDSIFTFDEYQKDCSLTDVGTSAQDCLNPGWLYYVMGIAGETGEFVEKVKKLFRDKKGIIDDEFKEQVIKEIGDIMWYQARFLSQFDISFGSVALENRRKLLDRLERNKLHGDGDNR